MKGVHLVILWFGTVVAAALLSAAAVILWWPPTTTTYEVLPPVTEAEGEAVTAGPIFTPDVIGLDTTTARRVLVDAGLSGDMTIIDTPAAGPEGIIRAQNPEPGGVADPVEIFVSAAVDIPELAGMTIDDARTALEDYDVQIRLVREVDPSVDSGQVLNSEPAAGEPLPTIIELTISDEGSWVWLNNVSVNDREGSCASINDLVAAGVRFDVALECTEPSTNDGFLEYSLDGRAIRISGSLTLRDAAPDSQMSVTITGDGVELGAFTLSPRQIEDYSFGITGVDRLRFTWSDNEIEDELPILVIAEPRLHGDPDLIEGL